MTSGADNAAAFLLPQAVADVTAGDVRVSVAGRVKKLLLQCKPRRA